jgi:DNA-binding MarR family transcriptional regulator
MPKNQKPFLLEGSNITFTTIPNYFLDKIAPTLNPSELRVMLYIYRHTLGFQKLNDSLSYDQFLHGVVTRDGRALDKGAGVSRGSLVAALSSLESKQLIQRQHTGKYGPVTIKLQPAALYDLTGEDEGSLAETEPAKANVAKNEARQDSKVSRFAVEEVSDSGNNQTLSEINQVQNLSLPVEKKQTGQVQKLTGTGDLEVQKLDPTKETKNQNQNKPDRDRAEKVIFGSKLITDSVPGITSQEARKLVEQAFINGRDQAYISRLVQHVTESRAIRIPAAVLTALIKANEDRLLPNRVSDPTFSGQRPFGSRRLANRNKLDIIQTGNKVTSKRGIDFSKYASLYPDFNKSQEVFYSDQEHSTAELLPNAAVANDNQVDHRLKYSLQEFDARLAISVRQLEVDNHTLKIGFWGTKSIPELSGWLPSVNIFYPQVTAIQVIS